MNFRGITVVAAAGAFLAVAVPAAAQTRPDTSFSESSRDTGPTCVIGGIVSNCAGSAASFPIGVGPVLVSPLSVAGPGLFPGGVFGGSAGGDVGTDTDVDRSTRAGTAAAR